MNMFFLCMCQDGCRCIFYLQISPINHKLLSTIDARTQLYLFRTQLYYLHWWWLILYINLQRNQSSFTSLLLYFNTGLSTNDATLKTSVQNLFTLSLSNQLFKILAGQNSDPGALTNLVWVWNPWRSLIWRH